MLHVITTGMKKEGKIQIFISEKKIGEAGQPSFCELKKNGNAISKEEKNFYVCISVGLGRSMLFTEESVLGPGQFTQNSV